LTLRAVGAGYAKHSFQRGSSVTNDRVSLYSLLYAVSENDAKAHLEELLDSAEDYPNFVDYIMALWERRENWGMAWRKIAGLRGHNTNNFGQVRVGVDG